jgi:hypothetical protein
MDATRFEALAAAYGADLRRWPETERDAARAFADTRADNASRLLDEARALDVLLDEVPAAIPSARLREAVIATAPRERRARARRWFLAPGAGLAAACAIGIVAGAMAAQYAATSVRADDVLVAAADQGDADAAEVS